MNHTDRLDALLQKRLKALVQDLDSARGGNVEALHRTRVASRRMREALPLLSDSPGHKLGKARRSARRLTRALGSVRELDVAAGLLDTIKPATPVQRVAIERVRAHLTRERDRLRKDMLERLTELKPNKFARRIADRLEERLADAGSDAPWRAALTTRLERRAERLLIAIDHAGELYLADRLHAVRIAAKKLRYSLELAGETGRGTTAPAVRTIKRVQDTLGHLHDYEVLADHVRQVQASLGSGEQDQSEALDLVLRDLVGECRRLHARYTTRREALRDVCAKVRELPRRLSAPKPPGTSTAADRKP